MKCCRSGGSRNGNVSAQLRVRREKAKTPRFRSPLRPGRPPGHRRKPLHEIDEVLAECHWLAGEAKKLDAN